MRRKPGPKIEDVGAEVEEQEQDGEFEIEAIVQYKPDAFNNPPAAGYKVKWKDYGPKENSWVRPEDALGALELIEAWWRKKGKQNPHAHLNNALADEGEGEGRQEEEDGGGDEGMENAELILEPESAPASKKRTRQSNGATTASAPHAKKAKRMSSPSAPAEDKVTKTVVHPSTLAKWKKIADWNKYVTEITTIEHDRQKIFVVFKLKGLEYPCSEPLATCKSRFPGKLLDFYEKNLRWQSVEGSYVVDNQ